MLLQYLALAPKFPAVVAEAATGGNRCLSLCWPWLLGSALEVLAAVHEVNHLLHIAVQAIHIIEPEQLRQGRNDHWLR